MLSGQLLTSASRALSEHCQGSRTRLVHPGHPRREWKLMLFRLADMTNFYRQYKAIKPFLQADSVPADGSECQFEQEGKGGSSEDG